MNSKVIFTSSFKSNMVNVFTGESQTIQFTKGETVMARIDAKNGNDVYFVDDDGWGAVMGKELIEIV